MRTKGGQEGGIHSVYRPQNVAIDVLLSFNFAVSLISMYFCFRQVNHNF